jgi:hypothetical protein
VWIPALNAHNHLDLIAARLTSYIPGSEPQRFGEPRRFGRNDVPAAGIKSHRRSPKVDTDVRSTEQN